jgi:hypothetical protein
MMNQQEPIYEVVWPIPKRAVKKHLPQSVFLI